jgi:hypothetical protein
VADRVFGCCVVVLSLDRSEFRKAEMARGKMKKNTHQQRYDAHNFPWVALPLDMLRYILEYLTHREIAFFDNSLLNHGVRALYLEATEKMPLSISVVLYSNLGVNELAWLILRGFSVKALTTKLQPLERTLLANSKESLREITFNYAKITDADIENLCLPNLISIRFYQCSGTLTSRGLRSFLIKSPRVKSMWLKIDYLSPDAIEVVGSCCPNLTDLDVSWSEWFGDGALRLLGESNLKLKSLNMTGLGTTDSLLSLIQKMPSLRRLQHPYLTRVDDWQHVLQLVALPGILSDDPNTQVMGLSHFSECFEYPIDSQRVEILFSMKAAINRLIEFLSLPTTRVSQTEVLRLLTSR